MFAKDIFNVEKLLYLISNVHKMKHAKNQFIWTQCNLLKDLIIMYNTDKK